MQKSQEEPVTEHVPLAVRWHRIRTIYRIANLATHHVLGFTLKLALLVYFVFAILFLFLRYAILPNIDFYKGAIEQAASRAVGNQVSISRIYASWQGLRPNLFLGDVQLRDKSGRQVLSLPSVSATLSWWSAVSGTVRFESLEIIRPDLQVRRSADGKLYVAGVYLAPDQGGDSTGADWVLSQHEIVIREGRLQWLDEMRGAAPVALDSVNFVLRNKWRGHQFGLRAQPPASLGEPIDVRAKFSHPAFSSHVSDAANWKGQIYANIDAADLAAWKAYLDYPFELTQGKGSVRTWLSFDHARLTGFTADVALAGVAARLGADLPALDLLQAQGRISASEVPPPRAASNQIPAGRRLPFGARGASVSLTDFSLATRDGLVLPATSLSAQRVVATAGQPEKTAFQAKLLDLTVLADVAARLPLRDAQRQLLERLAPRGRLLDVSAEWYGDVAHLRGYRVKGAVVGLGLKPQAGLPAQPASAGKPAQPASPAMPGFENLTGTIDASENGGSISIDAPGLVMQMPAWFSEPEMAFDRLALKARWSLAVKDELRVDLDSLDFTQQGLRATLHGSHVMALGSPKDGNAADTSRQAPQQGPGYADFTGTADGFDVKTIGRFLPLQTSPHLREWLTGALEDGKARDVTLRLRGDLSDFPFRAGASLGQQRKGEFRVAGRIENGKLNYAPAELSADGNGPLWPQAEQIKGSFLFEGPRMEIRGDTARTGGVALSGVKAVIADLGAPDKRLEIDGNAAGPMQEYLKYVAVSPVLGWISNFTEETSASGNARLALKLDLPLAHLLDSKVNGSLQLLGSDVVLWKDMPPVLGATGRIEFYERGVNLNGLAGTFLGGPVAVGGGTQRDGTIQVRIGGVMTADGLRKTWPAPAIARLTGRVSGSARYNALVNAHEHQVQVTVDSPLTGLGLDLPAPAGKAAADSMPLHFVLTATPANEAGLAHDNIGISLGNAISAHYYRQKQGRQAWRVVQGGIGVNVPAPEPDSGVALNVNVKTLDVDAWSALGGSGTGGNAAAGNAAGGNAAGGNAAGAAGQAGEGADLSQYVIPDSIAARATELILDERKLEQVVLGASHQNGAWQANIDSNQVSGYLTWNDMPSGPGKMTARLSSLVIPESAAADVKKLLEGNNTAAQTMPALDIIAERFELFNKPLGRLELLAFNASSAQASSGREWRVSKLSLANADGQLNGKGKWLVRDGKSTTNLDFTLDISDAGKLLDRMGFADTIRHGKGKLSGEVAWNGLPYSMDIPSLSGRIAMNVENGQFLKQDPGAAKLLGVLSLQALPRLLKLDFHDVFSEGLAFDGISADAAITRGVVKTDNLKMHGVAATVLMDGTADIANESTNLHVIVIPEFNLGTGPLVYALAVNPVIGVGSFLAQLFIRAPVMKALTYHMQVTGPWKSPVITKLDIDKLVPPQAEAQTQTQPGAGVPVK
jgi:uncharacterized protein (TIGR02099 family)